MEQVLNVHVKPKFEVHLIAFPDYFPYQRQAFTVCVAYSLGILVANDPFVSPSLTTRITSSWSQLACNVKNV